MGVEIKYPEIQEIFPPLPLEEWENTKDTLQLYVQIVGKIKLALMPRKNHWWNITLNVSPRGLTSSPIPYQSMTFEISFDFIDHIVSINTSKGEHKEIKLEQGLSVAEFYRTLFEYMSELKIYVKILAKPYDLKSCEPFATDYFNMAYRKEYVERFWKILVETDAILKEFTGRFYGKTSPVQLFWHSFDLAVSRYNGRRAPQMEDANRVNREAYTHEVIACGFWAGDRNIRFPSFYSYTFPAPEGINKVKLKPDKAFWIDWRGSPLALYKYEDFRNESDPKKSLLDFFESAYQAGAKKAGWDMKDFEVKPLELI